MSKTRKLIFWAAIWAIASVTLFNYHKDSHVATLAHSVDLQLRPGVSAGLPIYSLKGQILSFELVFNRNGWHDRREADLGSWTRAPGSPDRIKFLNPGKRIVTEVSVNGGPPIALEAMPASAYSETKIWRTLGDGPIGAAEWSWPPAHSVIRASAGKNEVIFRVVDVDPALRGEKVTLYVPPPASFSSVQPGYFMFAFHWLLYPFGIVILCVTGLILLYISCAEYSTIRRANPH